MIQRLRLVMVAALCAARAADAQQRGETRSVSEFVVVAGANAMAGGLTALVRALAAGRPSERPFVNGALGGLAQYWAKYLVCGSGSALQWGGMALGALGTSVVTNAGHGTDALSEFVLPIGPGRLRYSRSRGWHATLNAYEAGAFWYLATRDEVRFDPGTSLSFGALVIRDPGQLRGRRGIEAYGRTEGSVVVISDLASDGDAILRHELVHARQLWFLQEAWGRPTEAAIRGHIDRRGLVPDWLDLGLVVPLLVIAERKWIRSWPLTSLLEEEAGSIAKRRNTSGPLGRCMIP
jgi:hypothetical protein